MFLVVNVVLLIAKRYESLDPEYGICTCIYYVTHIYTVFASGCLCMLHNNKTLVGFSGSVSK